MSKRSLRDYIHDAFFARDKASLATIVKDAEEDIPPELLKKAAEEGGNGDHDEPDGDEGTKHQSAVHVHIEHGKASDSLDSRVGALETGMKSIDAKLSRIADALPDFLKKDDDKEPTKDEGELAGEEGAQTAEKLTAAEPDLMEADPALKTGPSKMGDAAYVAAVGKQVTALIQDTRARAEALSPGIRFATFDAKPNMATAKSVCDMRRAALTAAAGTEAGRKVLGRYTADAIKGLSCADVRRQFLDASDRVRDINNGQGRNHQLVVVDARSFRQGQQATLKSINQRNHEHWEKQMGRPN
jgi:hypothetical protein